MPSERQNDKAKRQTKKNYIPDHYKVSIKSTPSRAEQWRSGLSAIPVKPADKIKIH